MIVPNGSGTANAPNSANAAGELNRSFNESRSMNAIDRRPDRPRSGQVNGFFTTRRRAA
jgi:hypothetical protein